MATRALKWGALAYGWHKVAILVLSFVGGVLHRAEDRELGATKEEARADCGWFELEPVGSRWENVVFGGLALLAGLVRGR